MVRFKQFINEARLNKTETDLIDRARIHPQKSIAVTHEISSKSRKNRELEAAHSLVKKGHFKLSPAAASSEIEQKSKASKKRSYVTSVFKLNESRNVEENR